MLRRGGVRASGRDETRRKLERPEIDLQHLFEGRIMRLVSTLVAAAIAGAAIFGFSFVSFAQSPQAAAALPADPWPRDVSLSNAAVLVYQPQVNTWTGNQLDFRA